MVDEHDLAADRVVGRGASASTLSKATISPVTPSGPVEPLLPSAATTIVCGKGARISALSCPRTQTGMSNGSTRTLAKPIAVSFFTAQSRARASASVPARRGPTSVVRPSTMSQAYWSPSSAASRSAATLGSTVGDSMDLGGEGGGGGEQRGGDEEYEPWAGG